MNVISNGASYVVNLVSGKDKDTQVTSPGIFQLCNHYAPYSCISEK